LLGTFGKRRDHGITDLIKYRAKGKVRQNTVYLKFQIQRNFTGIFAQGQNIEVAYAQPDKQIIIALQVEESCTVGKAIELAGIIGQFPEIDLTKNKVGIFTK
jgi:hypothetical protein